MDKKNAWKVEPDLINRFLDVLTEDGFKWLSGPKANDLKYTLDDVTLLIIEELPKTLGYMRYAYYRKEVEEYSITEVTEELLQDMEDEKMWKMKRYERFGESSAEESAVKMIIGDVINDSREYSDSDIEALYERYKVMKQWLNEEVDAISDRDVDHS